jgi:hypothetical protein
VGQSAQKLGPWPAVRVGLLLGLAITLALSFAIASPAAGAGSQGAPRARPLTTAQDALTAMLRGLSAYQIWITESKDAACQSLEAPDLYASGFLAGDSRVSQLIAAAGLSDAQARKAVTEGYVFGCTKRPNKKQVRAAGIGAVALTVVSFTEGQMAAVCVKHRQDPASVVRVAAEQWPHPVLPTTFESGMRQSFAAICRRY